MIRTGLAAFAATLAVATPALPQQAGPPALMARLENYCIATGAKPKSVVAAARRDGMVAPPEAMMKDIAPELGDDFKDVEVLWSVHEKGAAMVMTGRVSDSESGMKGDVCGVISLPPTLALAKEFDSWLGLAAGQREEFNIFRASGGKRQIVKQTNAAEMVRGLRDGDLFAAGIMGDDDMSIVVVVKIEI